MASSSGDGGINKPLSLQCARGIKGIHAIAPTRERFFISGKRKRNEVGGERKTKRQLIKFLHHAKNHVPEHKNISGSFERGINAEVYGPR